MVKRARSGIVNYGGSMVVNGVAVGTGAKVVINGDKVEIEDGLELEEDDDF
jgi:hypothetical protein